MRGKSTIEGDLSASVHSGVASREEDTLPNLPMALGEKCTKFVNVKTRSPGIHRLVKGNIVSSSLKKI